MNNKITHTNSHGLIDTTELQKKWLDELDDRKKEWTPYDNPTDICQDCGSYANQEEIGRLICMARQGINYKTIEMVDGWNLEDLVAKVKLYENVLRDISNQVGKRASDLARVAAEALETNKEKVKNE